MENEEKITESVQEYYGETLQSSDDLKTNACCSIESVPRHIAAVIQKIHPEVREKFYGCGSPIPLELAGKTVLDLGCGTGRDVYTLSALVGPTGKVIGVDMTKKQLDVAKKHMQFHADAFGFANVEFKEGYIEDLQAMGLEDNSVDIVVSNCVINLSPNKEKVFREIYRVLKPGGELYFSDVFSDRRIPTELQKDPELYGECLSGALYTEDFRRIMRDIGWPDVRTFKESPIVLKDQIKDKLANYTFTSKTVRAFKLAHAEDICEDYGQVAVYRGTIPQNTAYFVLDDHHTLIAHKPMLVCGNTAAMLQDTRFGPHFTIIGDKSRHFGPFDCKQNKSETGTPDVCC